jgi:hypothetical protein
VHIEEILVSIVKRGAPPIAGELSIVSTLASAEVAYHPSMVGLSPEPFGWRQQHRH